ncbi:UNVERIFIED_CONTAM: hypothetical protein FKN15_050553, partial [Acipenser sinensis]
TVLQEVQAQSSSEEEHIFRGALDAKIRVWCTTVTVNQDNVQFKMDTGADVTAIPETMYTALAKKQHILLRKTDKVLMGPGRNALNVQGIFSAPITKSEKTVKEDIYVVQNLFTPLLDINAIENLNQIARLDNAKWLEKYNYLFSGLGELEEEYHIELKPGSKPFSLTVTRRISVPLIEQVKQELSRMEKLRNNN